MADEMGLVSHPRQHQPLRPFEVVVDGTDGAGKTTCVEFLSAQLRRHGHLVAVHAPYREVEVFPLWEEAPLDAAIRIIRAMANFRSAQPAADVILWDRGWPTAFVSTQMAAARACFAPFPALTLLLLHSLDRTIERARTKPNAGIWLTDPTRLQRYYDAYLRLDASEHPDEVHRFRPNALGNFDFRQIGEVVTRALDDRKAT